MLVTRIKSEWIRMDSLRTAFWAAIFVTVRVYLWSNGVAYCCCQLAQLTEWKKFMKISHRKGSTRVKYTTFTTT